MHTYHERRVLKCVYPVKPKSSHGIHLNTGEAQAAIKPGIISVYEARCLRNSKPMMNEVLWDRWRAAGLQATLEC